MAMTDNLSEKTSTTSADNLDDAANLRDPDQEDSSLLDGAGDGVDEDVDEAGLSLLEDSQIEVDEDPVRHNYY